MARGAPRCWCTGFEEASGTTEYFALQGQEEWKDTPPGRPPGPKFQSWRYHDEYEDDERGDAAA